MAHTTLKIALAATALLGAAPFAGLGAAQAATLVGLTADNRLVRIDSTTRRATAPVALRGADGALLGIDMRPADGKLYGITANNQIVTIDPATGQATQVARLSEPFVGGGRVVLDFNPAADRIRLMGMNGTSFRIHPDTGAVTRDGSLKYAAGTPLAETMPRVTAGAYVNSVAGATTTVLYTIDTSLSQLNVQMPPNDGVQVVRGPIGTALPAGIGFDILTEGTTNTAFLLAAGNLHTVNLETGAPTVLGPVIGLPAAEITDIAVVR